MKLPSFPSSADEIFDYAGPSEYLAGAIAGNGFNLVELIAFRRLRLQMGDLAFRRRLVDVWSILHASPAISTAAAWAYCFGCKEETSGY